MTMKRIIRADGEIERLAMANCLMLLSRVGGNGATAAASTGGPRVFACKTCNREFQSFQALGGHRASHRRPRLVAAAGGLLLRVRAPGSPAKPKTHECSICGLEFATGQALGGHTRRHRAVVDAGESTKEAVAVMMKKSSSSSSSNSKSVLCLDLNLTPYENDLIKVKKMASWFIA